MKIAHVYIEYPALELNRIFTYRCDSFVLQKGMRVQVPFGYKQLVGFVDRVEEVSDLYEDLQSYKMKSIMHVIDQVPLISDELFQLANYMSYHNIASMISCFQVMLPAKLKPRSGHSAIKMEKWVTYHHEDDGLTIKQNNALQTLKEQGDCKKSKWVEIFKSVTKKLIENGCVQEYEKEVEAQILASDTHDLPPILNDEQSDAIHKIMSHEGFCVSLLHGVTGSGKSEVYLQLAKQMLDQGKQVLILVPEISLTPQMVKRVKDRFSSEVAIYHSALNDQEKYEQFALVKANKVKIVVGTRSAIFMPFDHLGLIVLDEEHDQSYKQDKTPRYHCRDVALWRGKFHQAKVVLGSATPSLESYARAYKGNYQLVEMNHRINDNFPKVNMIEMRKVIKNGENYILSQELKKAIAKRLDAHEQIILLLNRRGYTPILRCVACGYVEMCPHCDIALSYHKDGHQLKCHTCGFQKPLIHFCPECSSQKWQFNGVGTQRLAEIVSQSFPQANIIRMDADTTSRKHAHEKLLDEFVNEGDILLGTQMIAKGLDFENVTLVGIINGDALLNRSDYRCSELTFDLLAQACGRSGRGSKSGEVILQAYDTQHYALTSAAQHDYKRFFSHEMNYRHLAKYPPYTYLGSIVIVHKVNEVAMQDIESLLSVMKKDNNLKVLGPSELLKIKDEYRYRILLKGTHRDVLLKCMHSLLNFHQQKKNKSRIELDMDPMMLD